MAEINLTCEQCDLTFTNEEDYHVHMQTHVKIEIIEEAPEEEIITDQPISPASLENECEDVTEVPEVKEEVVNEESTLEDSQQVDRWPRMKEEIIQDHFNNKLAVHMRGKIQGKISEIIQSLYERTPHRKTVVPMRKVSKRQMSEDQGSDSSNESSEERSDMHKCKYCVREFKNPSTLAVHERVHTGEKPFKCVVCEKAFATSGSLYRHMRFVHPSKKQQTPRRADPDLKCSLKFNLSTLMQLRFKDNSSSEKNPVPENCSNDTPSPVQRSDERSCFKCKVCRKYFNSQLNLRKHVLSVHEQSGDDDKDPLSKKQLRELEVKPHKCAVCLKGFGRKNSLKAHLLTHTKEKPSSCELCGRAFIRKDLLLRHTRKWHSRDNAILPD